MNRQISEQLAKLIDDIYVDIESETNGNVMFNNMLSYIINKLEDIRTDYLLEKINYDSEPPEHTDEELYNLANPTLKDETQPIVRAKIFARGDIGEIENLNIEKNDIIEIINDSYGDIVIIYTGF